MSESSSSIMEYLSEKDTEVMKRNTYKKPAESREKIKYSELNRGFFNQDEAENPEEKDESKDVLTESIVKEEARIA